MFYFCLFVCFLCVFVCFLCVFCGGFFAEKEIFYTIQKNIYGTVGTKIIFERRMLLIKASKMNEHISFFMGFKLYKIQIAHPAKEIDSV